MPYGVMPNGEPVPDKVIDDKGKLRPITARERIFAMAYGCPDSPTFANGTQSMRHVNPALSPVVADSMAREYLDKPRVAHTIASIINKAGLGVEVRADKLSQIISHRDIGRSVSKVVHDPDSGETTTIVERSPGWQHIIKAIDLVNKTEGLYDRNQAAADVAVEEYKALSKRFFGPQAPKRAGGGGRGESTVSSVSLVPEPDKNLQNEGKIEGSDGKP